MDLTPFGKPAAKSVPLPVRFWEELDQAAGVNLARAEGNLSVPAYLATAPERGILAELPAEQGQALVGQARAFIKSEFALSSPRKEHVAEVLANLPGGAVAEAAEKQAADFLEDFNLNALVRTRRAQGDLRIPPFKETFQPSLMDVPPAQTSALFSHFQAFVDSPHSDVTSIDRTLLADLRQDAQARLDKEGLKAIQQRPAVVDRSQDGSYSLTPEREA